MSEHQTDKTVKRNDNISTPSDIQLVTEDLMSENFQSRIQNVAWRLKLGLTLMGLKIPTSSTWQQGPHGDSELWESHALLDALCGTSDITRVVKRRAMRC